MNKGTYEPMNKRTYEPMNKRTQILCCLGLLFLSSSVSKFLSFLIFCSYIFLFLSSYVSKFFSFLVLLFYSITPHITALLR